MVRLTIFLWNRLRPKEGWLPFGLLLAVILSLATAVVEARWVPEVRVVVPTAIFGFLLGVLLAKRPLRAWQAWTLIALYGLVVTTIYLARLWPPLEVLFDSWEGYAQFNRQQMALFNDRWAGWIRAVSRGGSSRETVVFSFGLGLLAWHLAAYAGWSAFRQRRPLTGLSAVGVALAVNSYYGEVALWALLLFVPLTAVLAAVLNYATMQEDWERNKVSYPEFVRWEAAFSAAGVGTILLLAALIIPAINVRAISRFFFAQEAVQEAQDAVEQAFAGVRQPRRAGSEEPGLALPNSFLLGNAPDLTETVVMTATVLPETPPGLHWRGLSYDVYTGLGWEVSTERRESRPAGALIPMPPVSDTIALTQRVHWAFDARTTRYTLGLPRQFDQETTLVWRGLEDLAQVTSHQGQAYTAHSLASVARSGALQAATLAEVPPVLIGRYTALPESVPERVHALAAEITGGLASPYDQARAIEAFLRQYPYSLSLPPLPRDRDLVDTFLFDVQQGYCDYYASAMVVLARSAGLPARFAVGYLAQPPDESGVQTVVQLNAHAWAEVYFASYGWIEFEPTAPFPTRVPGLPAGDAADAPPEIETAATSFTPPPLPPADPEQRFPWPLAVSVAVLLLSLATRLVWGREKAEGEDGLGRAYGSLLRQARGLGVATPESQTPAEFAQALSGHLSEWPAGTRPGVWAATIRTGARYLVELFTRRQYAAPGQRPAEPEAAQAWRAIRRPLWYLRLYRRLKPPPERPGEA